MLILSRKRNDSIRIGDNITITVVEISGDTIKIGIDAPKNIQIIRSELLKAVEQENKNAASPRSAIFDLAQLIKGDQK